MTMLNAKNNVKQELLQLMEALGEENSDVTLVSLSTTDGFPIRCFSKDALSAQVDKVAALSSTLSALSNSSALQMNQGKCDITIIEAAAGNIMFVRTEYLKTQCVLTVLASNKMALAVARYKTKNLAQAIANIAD